MFTYGDGPAVDVALQQVVQVQRFVAVVGDIEAQHLVEVAVVDVTAPVHADQAAAHDLLQVGGVVRLFQGEQIPVQLPLADQCAAETLDGHVAQGVQVVEGDAVLIIKVCLVFLLQFLLPRRQERAQGIIDQVQGKPAAGPAVAQVVEPAQGGNALREHSLAALPVHVLLRVARQGGDDLHALPRQEPRQVLESRFLQYGEIAAVNDVHAQVAGAYHQAAETGVHLRRPAGNIQRADLFPAQEIYDRVQGGLPHFFLAVGIGIGVAMQAGQIAAQPYVDLQSLQFASLYGGEIAGLQMRQGLMHGLGSRPV